MRRKSTSVKKLQGTYQASRDRKRVQFATADGAAIKAPAFVRKNKIAFGEWKNLLPHLLTGRILTQLDLSILSNYVTTYSHWRAAIEDVEKQGATILITSTTRTGKTEKPVINPAVRNEILYSAALVKIGTKLGLNPLDRSRVIVEEADDEGPDPFERFLEEGNDDPELDYLGFKSSSRN